MSERTQDDSGEEDYGEELQDKMDGSGGCAEAWQAAQEIRESEKSGSLNVGRRRVLTGIGASLIFGVSATDTIAATSNTTPPENLDTDVIELVGDKKRKVVKAARADNTVRSARDQLKSNGWTPNVDEATAQKSVHEEESSFTVKIPYQNANSSPSGVQESAGIIWSTWNSGLTHGFISRREIRKGASLSKEVKDLYDNTDISVQSSNVVPVEVSYTIFNENRSGTLKGADSNAAQSTTATVSGNTARSPPSNSVVVPVQKSSSKTSSSQSGVSTQSVGGVTPESVVDCACTASLGTNPVTACAPCGTVKPDCLVQIIANYGATIGACAGCGTVAVLTEGAGAIAGGCLPCLGAISQTAASGNINSICCWCNFGGDFV